MSKHDFKTKVSTLIQRRIEDQNVANYENNKQDYRKRFVKKEEGSGLMGFGFGQAVFAGTNFFYSYSLFSVYFFSLTSIYSQFF